MVIVDERTLAGGRHEHTHLDLGDAGTTGAELPLHAVRRIVQRSRVVPVVRDGNGIVTQVGARGSPLDLGRTTRLASWAQRYALQVMHPTCGVPGCGVPFAHCQPHHVHWWEHGGTTDLRNLLPLCSRHHHLVHDRGWQLVLTRERTVIVRLPDGTRRTEVLGRRWPR